MPRSETVNVVGIVKINGQTDGSRPDVCVGDHGLFIDARGHSRSTVSLNTFNKAMANALDFGLIAKPIVYVIEGTCLGLYIQNFGDMREPDFYNRVITRVKIAITHDKQSITYNIEGLAALREGEIVRPDSTPTGDWTFDIWFKIPREELEHFYGLTSTARDSYFKYMDAL